MYTEEEAKTKLCHALVAGILGTDEDLKFARCLASGCMQWRWAGPQTEQVFKSKEDKDWHLAHPPGNWRYVCSYDDGKNLFERTLSEAPHVGYCGLSGNPR